MNQIKMQFDITFMNKKQKIKKIAKKQASKKYKIEPTKIDIKIEPNLRTVK